MLMDPIIALVAFRWGTIPGFHVAIMAPHSHEFSILIAVAVAVVVVALTAARATAIVIARLKVTGVAVFLIFNCVAPSM